MIQSSLSSRLRLSVAAMLPAACLLFAILLGMVPFRLFDLGPVMPGLALLVVWYFSIERPDLLPAWLVFSLAVLGDLLAKAPLGAGAIILVSVHWAGSSQRRFFLREPFLMQWLAFTVVCAVAILLNWLINMLFFFSLIDPLAPLISCLLTVALCPPSVWLLAHVNRLL